MVARARRTQAPIHELTLDEGRQLLDREALARLGLSAEEFIDKWQSRAFGDPDETNPDIWHVAMLLPGVGIDPWA
jgi:hypothetical protein